VFAAAWGGGPGGAAGGLRAEYFQDNALERPWFSRTDATVNFKFGTDGPLPRRVAPGGTTPPAALALDVPGGSWRVSWLDPVSGRVLKEERVEGHPGRLLRLAEPRWMDDVAVSIRRNAPN
jgi:hypothetical protein